VALRFSRSSKVSEDDKKKYIAAAKNFRLPYWDYYRPRDYTVTIPGVVDGNTTTSPYDYHAPKIFTLKKIMVKVLPDNELKAMENPFFNYQFEAADSSRIQWKFSDLDVSSTWPWKKVLFSLTCHRQHWPTPKISPFATEDPTQPMSHP
jgi:hypothetical protein